ncbi:MAG TPA: STAS domain-containing protein [Candidatus Limnocylindrales bacterium]|nr:STAS domain-containing protein [Candidatus Limnocylindrales bacterium]
MDITTEQQGEYLDVRIDGRLDAYWADHLSRSLEDAVTGGGHRIRIRMSGVSYMSSVGLRVLVKFYKQLGSLGGSLQVIDPAEPVRSVIRMAGLETLLATSTGESSQRSAPDIVERLETEDGRYEVYELAAGAALTCEVVGSPLRLEQSFSETDCRTLALPATTFAIGLGAFGSFADSCGRFGELVAVAGAAAWLPTDGTNVPDYLLSTGSFVSGISVLYALVCDGGFRKLMRFEERTKGDPLALSSIVRQALAAGGGEHVGIVMLAETAGLVGATLRRSPALGESSSSMFAYPQIRDWLSYSSEPSHRRQLALIAGVASTSPHALLDPFLRPLASSPQKTTGHFHAAIFPSRPLAKGRINLHDTVASLFENESLQSVIHLLADDRAGVGAGQSELIRGACWVAPIGDVRS